MEQSLEFVQRSKVSFRKYSQVWSKSIVRGEEKEICLNIACWTEARALCRIFFGFVPSKEEERKLCVKNKSWSLKSWSIKLSKKKIKCFKKIKILTSWSGWCAPVPPATQPGAEGLLESKNLRLYWATYWDLPSSTNTHLKMKKQKKNTIHCMQLVRSILTGNTVGCSEQFWEFHVPLNCEGRVSMMLISCPLALWGCQHQEEEAVDLRVRTSYLRQVSGPSRSDRVAG